MTSAVQLFVARTERQKLGSVPNGFPYAGRKEIAAGAIGALGGRDQKFDLRIDDGEHLGGLLGGPAEFGVAGHQQGSAGAGAILVGATASILTQKDAAGLFTRMGGEVRWAIPVTLALQPIPIQLDPPGPHALREQQGLVMGNAHPDAATVGATPVASDGTHRLRADGLKGPNGGVHPAVQTPSPIRPRREDRDGAGFLCKGGARGFLCFWG